MPRTGTQKADLVGMSLYPVLHAHRDPQTPGRPTWPWPELPGRSVLEGSTSGESRWLQPPAAQARSLSVPGDSAPLTEKPASADQSGHHIQPRLCCAVA